MEVCQSTLISSHSHTSSGHVWLSISAKRHPPWGTNKTLCYGKQKHPFPLSNQRPVCLGRRLSLVPPPRGFLTQALFPDPWHRRDERVYNTASLFCLISLHRVMIKADPLSTMLPHQIQDQTKGVSFKHTRTQVIWGRMFLICSKILF